MGCGSLGIERVGMAACFLLLQDFVHRRLSWSGSRVGWVLLETIVDRFL